MRRRSKGVYEFTQPTLGWYTRSQLRSIKESGRDVSCIVSPDWIPISPAEPMIPQYELTPWLPLPKMSTMRPWEEDFWMTQNISSVRSGKKLLKQIYSVLIERNEKTFYKEYIPIRWYTGLIQDFDETLNKFKYEKTESVIAGNFAISEEFVRPSILKRANKLGIEVKNPEMIRTILWARREIVLSCDFGKTMINYWKCMDERALKFGIPSYPLHLDLVSEGF